LETRVFEPRNSQQRTTTPHKHQVKKKKKKKKKTLLQLIKIYFKKKIGPGGPSAPHFDEEAGSDVGGGGGGGGGATRVGKVGGSWEKPLQPLVYTLSHCLVAHRELVQVPIDRSLISLSPQTYQDAPNYELLPPVPAPIFIDKY
jgi:hypothetical protein